MYAKFVIYDPKNPTQRRNISGDNEDQTQSYIPYRSVTLEGKRFDYQKVNIAGLDPDSLPHELNHANRLTSIRDTNEIILLVVYNDGSTINAERYVACGELTALYIMNNAGNTIDKVITTGQVVPSE